MIFKRDEALPIVKNDVSMWVYMGADDSPNASVVYQETEFGHTEEFYHDRSAFIFYVIEGSGVWTIEGREYPVAATDVVVVPPGQRFYYRGKLKQLCITAPAWQAEHEHHVRYIPR